MSIPASAAAASVLLAVGNLLLEDVKIGDLLVSACTGLSGANELEITRKPIGTGYVITDAAVDVPIEKTLDIVFSNPQFSPEKLAQALLTGEIESYTESWRDKKDKLYEMQKNRDIVTLQTHENSYENMLIRVIDPVFDNVENWDGWLGTVILSQIIPIAADSGGGILDSGEEAV